MDNWNSKSYENHTIISTVLIFLLNLKFALLEGFYLVLFVWIKQDPPVPHYINICSNFVISKRTVSETDWRYIFSVFHSETIFAFVNETGNKMFLDTAQVSPRKDSRIVMTDLCLNLISLQTKRLAYSWWAGPLTAKISIFILALPDNRPLVGNVLATDRPWKPTFAKEKIQGLCCRINGLYSWWEGSLASQNIKFLLVLPDYETRDHWWGWCASYMWRDLKQ